MPARRPLLCLTLLLVSVSQASAVVRVRADQVVGAGGAQVIVPVLLDTDGESVGGVQNDLLFDHRILSLAGASACRINPEIGTAQAGCEEDPVVGPCKTLSRNLASCASQPLPVGCVTADPNVSRFRGIIASTAIPNRNPIPPGSVLYTCTFDVVAPQLLPAFLLNRNIAASDPLGARLDSSPVHGGVVVSEDQLPLPTWTNPPPSSTPTRTPLPPTPTAPSPTPTAVVLSNTHTPTFTYTLSRTHTPTATATSTATEGPALGVEIGRAAAAGGIAHIEIRLRANGLQVGGIQNDILFDHTVVRLPSAAACTIAPEISDRDPDCENDAEGSGKPCKALSRHLANCGDAPLPEDCPAGSPHLSRFRALIAATGVPNRNPIPDGALLYSCDFEVVAPERLPAHLAGSEAAGSDPFGARLTAEVVPGSVLAAGSKEPAPTWTPSPPPTATLSRTATLTRTATPTRSATPTRTATASFTWTGTPTATRTPQPNGATCIGAGECVSGNCLEAICCDSAVCSSGMGCSVSGSEGTCAALRLLGEGCNDGDDCVSRECAEVPAAEQPDYQGECVPFTGLRPHRPGVGSGVRVVVGSAQINDDDTATVPIWLRSGGFQVGGIQSDILFDGDLLRLPSAAACRIADAIATNQPGCDEDPVIGPCKTLSRDLSSCDEEPRPPGCRSGAPNLDRFRAIIAATAVPNNNAIPDRAVLYSCTFEVLDPSALPILLVINNVVASDPTGTRLDVFASDGAVAGEAGGIAPTWTPVLNATPTAPATAAPSSTTSLSFTATPTDSAPIPSRTSTAGALLPSPSATATSPAGNEDDGCALHSDPAADGIPWLALGIVAFALRRRPRR